MRSVTCWLPSWPRRPDTFFLFLITVLELEPDYGLAIYNQGLAYRMKGMADMAGQHDQSKSILRQLEAQYGGSNPVAIASVYYALGEDAKALDLLEKGLEVQPGVLANATSEPVFDRLRSHPRFQALRRAMNLP